MIAMIIIIIASNIINKMRLESKYKYKLAMKEAAYRIIIWNLMMSYLIFTYRKIIINFG